jgi:hypothetical protein
MSYPNIPAPGFRTIYLPSTGSPSVTPAFDSNWTVTSSASRIQAALDAPSGTGFATITVSGTTGAKQAAGLAAQFVTPPICLAYATASAFSIGQVVDDGSGHLQQCIVAGTTDSTAPVWNHAGGTTIDGGVTWQDCGRTLISKANGNRILVAWGTARCQQLSISGSGNYLCPGSILAFLYSSSGSLKAAIGPYGHATNGYPGSYGFYACPASSLIEELFPGNNDYAGYPSFTVAAGDYLVIEIGFTVGFNASSGISWSGEIEFGDSASSDLSGSRVYPPLSSSAGQFNPNVLLWYSGAVGSTAPVGPPSIPGAWYVVNEPGLGLTDRTAYLHMKGKHNLQLQLRQRGKASYTLRAKPGDSYAPTIGSPVFFFDQTASAQTLVFSGFIQTYTQRIVGSAGLCYYDVTAVSLEAVFDTVYVDTPVQYVNQPCGVIIEDLFNRFEAGSSVSLGAIQSGETVPLFNATVGDKLSDLFGQLATTSQFVWNVNPQTLQLFFGLPSVSPAPFEITSSQALWNSITCKYDNADYRNGQAVKLSYDAFAHSMEFFTGSGQKTFTLSRPVDQVSNAYVTLSTCNTATGSFSGLPASGDTITIGPASGAWQASHTYALGGIIVVNGYVQAVSYAGISGGSQPVFSTVTGGTTTDGTAIWTCKGPAGLGTGVQTYTFVPAAPAAAWLPSTAFATNATINSGGYIQKATTGGTSGALQPVFSTTTGSTVTDGSVTWTCEGPCLDNTQFGQVVIGSTSASTCQNLVDAINRYIGGVAGRGPGKNYSKPTWENGQCNAIYSGGTSFTLQQKAAGAGWIASITASSSAFSWSAATTSGGTSPQGSVGPNEGATITLQVYVQGTSTAAPGLAYTPGSAVVTLATPLNSGTNLNVEYTRADGDIIQVEDSALVTQMAAVTHGTGKFQQATDQSKLGVISTSSLAGLKLAQQIIAAFGVTPQEIAVELFQPGILPGQQITLDLGGSLAALNGEYVVQEIQAELVPPGVRGYLDSAQVPGGGHYRYTARLIDVNQIASWLEFWEGMGGGAGGSGLGSSLVSTSGGAQANNGASGSTSAALTLQTNGTANSSTSLLNLEQGSFTTVQDVGGGSIRIDLAGSSTPWASSHSYSAANTVVDSNGNVQEAEYFGPFWQAGHAYSVGAVVSPRPPAAGSYTGYKMVCTAAGTSGSTQPTWNNPPVSSAWAASHSYSSTNTVVDSNGNVQEAEYFGPFWQASQAYSLGAVVYGRPPYPSGSTYGGYKMVCTTAGTSGSTQPTWTNAPEIYWSPSISYALNAEIVDSNGNVQKAVAFCDSTAPFWSPSTVFLNHAYVYGQPPDSGTHANSKWQNIYGYAGTTGSTQPTWNGTYVTGDGSINWGYVSGPLSSGVSGSSTPSWNTTTGGYTYEGYIAWENMGPAGSGYTITDGSVVWTNEGSPITAATSGSTAPSWNTTTSGITFDNNVAWVNQGASSSAISDGGVTWLNEGSAVATSGSSGSTAPSWNTSSGGYTFDNNVAWVNLGAFTAPARVQFVASSWSALHLPTWDINGNLADSGVAFPIPVASGGTGATTATGALSNLGISLPLPISSGGTGVTTAAAAAAALGAVQAANNLSDLASVTTALANLGLSSSSNVTFNGVSCSGLAISGTGSATFSFEAPFLIADTAFQVYDTGHVLHTGGTATVTIGSTTLTFIGGLYIS